MGNARRLSSIWDAVPPEEQALSLKSRKSDRLAACRKADADGGTTSPSGVTSVLPEAKEDLAT